MLGVSAKAPQADIKRAYHRLARKFHPDHNGGHTLAQHRFRLIAEAYEVLGDPQSRAQFDRYGSSALVRRENTPGFVGDVERFVSDLGTLVEDRIRRQSQRGQDCRTELALSFRDACLGTLATVEVMRETDCRSCDGTGAQLDSAIESCHVCGGDGEVKRNVRIPLLPVTDSCLFCHGTGKIAIAPCDVCDGDGKIQAMQKIPIEVPAMVESGRRLVIKRYGQPGINGGAPGDLYVVIQVVDDDLLSRDGYDLQCTVPLKLSEAMFGAKVPVPTLDGKNVKIKVPAGAHNGQQLRLKGRGIPRKSGSPGDLYIQLQLETPHLSSSSDAGLVDQIEQHVSYPRRLRYEELLESST